MKRRWGESRNGSEEEHVQWYHILNAITPSYEGISERDFKMARETMMQLVQDRMHNKSFKRLMQTEMARMAGYSEQTQAKMMEAWTSETNNPKLYGEIM